MNEENDTILGLLLESMGDLWMRLLSILKGGKTMKILIVIFAVITLSGCAISTSRERLAKQSQMQYWLTEVQVNPEKYNQEQLKQIINKLEDLRREIQDLYREEVIRRENAQRIAALFR